MNTLIIDASNNNLCVVIEKGKQVFSCFYKCNLNHSKIINQTIEDLCNEAGLALSDFDIFGICVGPGSFTGIRIGIATVKGYNFAYEKKIITVNSLEVLSYTVPHEKVNCFFLDGKDSIYFASYNKNLCVLEPTLIDKQQYDTMINDTTVNSVVYNSLFDPSKALITAVKRKIENNDFTLEPQALYIRKCQAELEKEQKNASAN